MSDAVGRMAVIEANMALTQSEFEALIADGTKTVVGDIEWSEDEDHSPSVEFRAEVGSTAGYPLFVKGTYNPAAKALSLVLIHRPAGRIYGLCLGKDHHNPTCQNVGEKHKHRWTEEFRDKQAYVPDEITAAATAVVQAWTEFCAESRITHSGTMRPPAPFQEALFP